MTLSKVLSVRSKRPTRFWASSGSCDGKEEGGYVIFETLRISEGWFLISTEKETALVDRETLKLLMKQLLSPGGKT